MYTHVHSKQPKCISMGKWIDKLWSTYTMEYYLTLKGKEIPTAITWMNLEDMMLSEISQSEIDKYCVISSSGRSLE